MFVFFVISPYSLEMESSSVHPFLVFFPLIFAYGEKLSGGGGRLLLATNQSHMQETEK